MRIVAVALVLLLCLQAISAFRARQSVVWVAPHTEACHLACADINATDVAFRLETESELGRAVRAPRGPLRLNATGHLCYVPAAEDVFPFAVLVSAGAACNESVLWVPLVIAPVPRHDVEEGHSRGAPDASLFTDVVQRRGGQPGHPGEGAHGGPAGLPRWARSARIDASVFGFSSCPDTGFCGDGGL